MDEFIVVEIMNNAMIEMLKNQDKDYEINKDISEKLKDKAFFFKVEKETAIDVLKNIGIKNDQIEVFYNELISKNRFYDLIQKGIIKIDDKDLVIKYEMYRK